MPERGIHPFELQKNRETAKKFPNPFVSVFFFVNLRKENAKIAYSYDKQTTVGTGEYRRDRRLK
jgi:hypothetical protein